MTKEHKKALQKIKSVGAKNVLSVYIDECLISDEEIEILRRWLIKDDLQVAIANDMGYDKDTINKKISKAILVLEKVIDLYTT